MPFVFCEKHGYSISPHGCCHVSKKVRLGIKSEELEYVDIHGGFYAGWMCKNCIEKLNRHGFQDYLRRNKNRKEEPSANETDHYLGLIDLQPLCQKCLSELNGVDGPWRSDND